MPSAEDGFAPADAELNGLTDDPPQAMSLFAGDVVTLRVQSLETQEIAGLSVDERGMLHVPLAGDVAVGGLALVQAEEAIETALHRFDRSARVTVIMTEPAGHMATVIGAVGAQGRIAIIPGMRVADLIAAAGGPGTVEEAGVAAPIADLQSARLMRGGETVPVSIARAISGDPRHNVRVRPGDHLYVPPQMGTLVSVIGEVHAARAFGHFPGLRLSTALALAGGPTRDANQGDIRIVRGISTSPRVYQAGMNRVINGQADPILAPGDVVYVGSSFLADFRDVMAAIAPIISIAATTAVGIAIGVTAAP
jgi:polysaccharide export outer membrane protein